MTNDKLPYFYTTIIKFQLSIINYFRAVLVIVNSARLLIYIFIKLTITLCDVIQLRGSATI